jgi:hypothetical protein
MVMMAKVSLDDPAAALAKLCLKAEAARRNKRPVVELCSMGEITISDIREQSYITLPTESNLLNNACTYQITVLTYNDQFCGEAYTSAAVNHIVSE